MSRKKTREDLMKILYQLEIQKDSPEKQIEEFIERNSEMTGENKEYFKDVAFGVLRKKDKTDKLIDKYARGWSLDRMPKVDIAIMRLGIYEIFFRDDIPLSVSVNEAVELAKKYSTEQSGAFINGILGRIIKKEVEKKAGKDK